MVVYVHSLGSVWQEKSDTIRGSRIWNTTGIEDGRRIRPRSTLFGQVSLGNAARVELNKSGRLTPGTWVASAMNVYKGIPRIHLQHRTKASNVPEWYLVVVTETLIGQLHELSFGAAGGETTMVSYSIWKEREEAMLLMRPFASLKGERGTAVLIPQTPGCRWQTTEWIRE
ncbi:MAG: hypothetical protein ACRD7E_27080 [Bryobacteraceae bacterium]